MSRTRKLFDVTGDGINQPTVNTSPNFPQTSPNFPQNPPNFPQSSPQPRGIPSLKNGDAFDSTITAQSTIQSASFGLFGLGGQLDAPGDEYKIEADAGAKVTIRISRKGSLKTFLALRDPNGNQIAESRDNLNNFSLSQAGTYSLSIIADNGTLGSYGLRFNGSGLRPVNNSSNNNNNFNNNSSTNSSFNKTFRTAFTGSNFCMDISARTFEVKLFSCQQSSSRWSIKPSQNSGFFLIQSRLANGIGGESCLTVSSFPERLTMKSMINDN
jgi:hypothetical protein